MQTQHFEAEIDKIESREALKPALSVFESRHTIRKNCPTSLLVLLPALMTTYPIQANASTIQNVVQQKSELDFVKIQPQLKFNRTPATFDISKMIKSTP